MLTRIGNVREPYVTLAKVRATIVGIVANPRGDARHIKHLALLPVLQRRRKRIFAQVLGRKSATAVARLRPPPKSRIILLAIAARRPEL